MMKMSQKKSDYYVKIVQESEAECSEQAPDSKRKRKDSDSSGGETMEEDDRSNFDSLIQNDKAPVLFNGKKRKDKTLKCRKCCLGGHLDVHCPLQVEEKFSCHICENEETDHDAFSCPWNLERCKACGIQGHNSQVCRMGELHCEILKAKPWSCRVPAVAYQRIQHCDQLLDFDFDRMISTDLRKLLKLTQNQVWLNFK
jgi:hypothetical protein